MSGNDDLVRGVKVVMIKVWQLPPGTAAGELDKYSSLLLARIDAGDTRYALDLQARDIQVNWLKLPLTKDYSEVVDWMLALVRNARQVSS
jgi:hypothetical protein